ncbi:GNAT family N-acetyltransferase [Nocardia iowensis]|uniref:GNAT family N-acetyltransferase n=1 Tax=Nocardia iowensis TaxID=204891 RepID=A0ABX8RM79_NOCIO|nr:GNAT family N-acetyltransferase [Nocardia iowensis]QXN90729.1 GNAT family N-acetyltransferase [Nocardia iowensis]
MTAPLHPGLAVTVVDDGGRTRARLSSGPDGLRIEAGGDSCVVTAVDQAREPLRTLGELGELRVLATAQLWPVERYDGLLLLAVAAHWPELLLPDGTRLHVVLGYALPVALHPDWLGWAERNLAALIEADQLGTVAAADLVAVEPEPSLRRKHKRLLRMHAETVVVEDGDVDEFLSHWQSFSAERYRDESAARSSALRDLLQMSGSRIRRFSNSGKVICRSAVCTDPDGRALFDIMASWDSEAARLRPGIYAAVHNLIDAGERGLYYSLCYGNYPYKDIVVGTSPRLTLPDLISR